MGSYASWSIALILLAACGPSTRAARPVRPTWYKPTVTQQQYAQERYHCMRETGSDGGPTELTEMQNFGRGMGELGDAMGGKSYLIEKRRAMVREKLFRNRLFAACMESKGYSR